jgi:dihydroxyacetone kinase
LVLSNAAGGTGRRRSPRWADDDGSQSIEFALAIPFVVLALVVLLHTGLFAADLVAANAVAFQAARVASIDDDAAVTQAARSAAGRRPVTVDVDPPDNQRHAGDLVAATVRVRSAAFEALGATVWIPARMTLRVERP